MSPQSIRCYSKFLQEESYHVEIYKPWKKYAAIIFLNRNKKNYLLAQKLKKQNVKIFLDVNANLFDDRLYSGNIFKELDKSYQENFVLFCKLADAIITPSPFLKEKASLLYDQKGIYIPEIIPYIFFKKRKFSLHTSLLL